MQMHLYQTCSLGLYVVTSIHVATLIDMVERETGQRLQTNATDVEFPLTFGSNITQKSIY